MRHLKPLQTKPESLTQMVYDSIREAIISKALEPGTPVSEAGLSRDLQVSKTPVREALLRLQVVGLIESDGGRGARVVSPSREIIEQAYEVRAVLEAGAARVAAQRATEEQRREMLEAAVNSRDAAVGGDVDGFRHWDGVFHLMVAEGTQNPRLVTLVENALSLTSVLRQRDAPAKSDASRCGEQHIAIATAILEGRGTDAAEAAAAHALDVQHIVMQSIAARLAAEGADAAPGQRRPVPPPPLPRAGSDL